MSEKKLTWECYGQAFMPCTACGNYDGVESLFNFWVPRMQEAYPMHLACGQSLGLYEACSLFWKYMKNWEGRQSISTAAEPVKYRRAVFIEHEG